MHCSSATFLVRSLLRRLSLLFLPSINIFEYCIELFFSSFGVLSICLVLLSNGQHQMDAYRNVLSRSIYKNRYRPIGFIMFCLLFWHNTYIYQPNKWYRNHDEIHVRNIDEVKPLLIDENDCSISVVRPKSITWKSIQSEMESRQHDYEPSQFQASSS